MKISSWVILAGFVSWTAAIYYSAITWSFKFFLLGFLFFAVSATIEELD